MAREPLRQTFADLSLDDLSDRMAVEDQGSKVAHAAHAEIQRRLAESSLDADKATKRTATYMLLSVVVLAVASVINVLVAVFSK